MAFLRTNRISKDDIKEATKKASKVSKVKSSMNGVAGIIDMITVQVNKLLGKYKDKYIVIRTKEALIEYLANLKDNQLIAIDTETTSLETMYTTLAGVCLYYEGAKPCYIPVNHRSYVTGEKSKNQVEEKDIKELLGNLKVRWVLHNADFDIRVLRHTLGLYLDCYWDTLIAAKLINENEPAGLKELHIKYCKGEDDMPITYSSLFSKVKFPDVPIDVAYLYAAGDPLKTLELMKVQEEYFNQKGNEKLFSVFKDIEIPLVEVVADMEDLGVAFDFEVSNKLIEKYSKLKVEKLEKAYNEISKYENDIENYKLKNHNHKLDTPINLASPTQLAILLYDILKVTHNNKKSPRGTGEEILLELAKGSLKDLCLSILELRGVEKLLNTYILKMPNEAKKTGRVHTNFNQVGTVTGRFSSSDPNLQNIPSHNQEIRQMFKATDGYVLIGSDYSKQEIFIAASISQDEKMIESCKKDTDIYSEIASIAFNLPYEKCVEFLEDGTKSIEGKERRGQAKAIVLGILYGKGVNAIAKDLNISNTKAEEVYKKVLRAFPKLKNFMEDSQKNAKEKGYVETAWGRRRHLPDMSLDKYTFKLASNKPLYFDPLDFDGDTLLEVPYNLKQKYTMLMDKAYGLSEKRKIEQKALEEGIKIVNNGGFIAESERQCVNSRVQGSAGDVTKIAMNMVARNKTLKELGFRLLLTIHDELIGECKIENAKQASQIFSQLMIEAAEGVIQVPMRTDIEFTLNWSGKKVQIHD